MRHRIAMVTLKPREGRQNLVRQPTDRECRPFPCPLPRRAGEGGQKGVGAIFPRAFALGYYLPSVSRRTGETYITDHWDRALAGKRRQGPFFVAMR